MRYFILVILTFPVILLALINIITQYKMKKVSQQRFRHQLILWLFILVVLICSFPIYNLAVGKPILDSSELSLFDVFEITAIIYILYIVNDHRRKIERNEKTARDLHQELSIKLSKKRK
jgi:hypothetical protein